MMPFTKEVLLRRIFEIEKLATSNVLSYVLIAYYVLIVQLNHFFFVSIQLRLASSTSDLALESDIKCNSGRDLTFFLLEIVLTFLSNAC